MKRPFRSAVAAIAVAALFSGCAELQDRQVLNPGKDWRSPSRRSQRVAKLKAPFVTLGNKLKSIGAPPTTPELRVEPLDGPEPLP